MCCKLIKQFKPPSPTSLLTGCLSASYSWLLLGVSWEARASLRLSRINHEGPPRNIVFECPFYRILATLPGGFFPGKRSHNALRDIEDEIYSRSGVRDDMKRDGLARAITGTPQFLLTMKYNCPGQNSTLVS